MSQPNAVAGKKGFQTLPVEARLWAKVVKADGCWLWTGGKAGHGYGTISRGGKVTRVHRLSYELAFGTIPPGLEVCHRCDMPACVRPDHLFLGTHRENMQDSYRKGRSGTNRVGRKPWKLTNADLSAIKASAAKTKALAEQYGVDKATIRQIRNGRYCRAALAGGGKDGQT